MHLIGIEEFCRQELSVKSVRMGMGFGRESDDQSHQEWWYDLEVMVTRVVKSYHELLTKQFGARTIQSHISSCPVNERDCGKEWLPPVEKINEVVVLSLLSQSSVSFKATFVESSEIL